MLTQLTSVTSTNTANINTNSNANASISIDSSIDPAISTIGLSVETNIQYHNCWSDSCKKQKLFFSFFPLSSQEQICKAFTTLNGACVLSSNGAPILRSYLKAAVLAFNSAINTEINSTLAAKASIVDVQGAQDNSDGNINLSAAMEGTGLLSHLYAKISKEISIDLFEQMFKIAGDSAALSTLLQVSAVGQNDQNTILDCLFTQYSTTNAQTILFESIQIESQAEDTDYLTFSAAVSAVNKVKVINKGKLSNKSNALYNACTNISDSQNKSICQNSQSCGAALYAECNTSSDINACTVNFFSNASNITKCNSAEKKIQKAISNISSTISENVKNYKTNAKDSLSSIDQIKVSAKTNAQATIQNVEKALNAAKEKISEIFSSIINVIISKSADSASSSASVSASASGNTVIIVNSTNNTNSTIISSSSSSNSTSKISNSNTTSSSPINTNNNSTNSTANATVSTNSSSTLRLLETTTSTVNANATVSSNSNSTSANATVLINSNSNTTSANATVTIVAGNSTIIYISSNSTSGNNTNSTETSNNTNLINSTSNVIINAALTPFDIIEAYFGKSAQATDLTNIYNLLVQFSGSNNDTITENELNLILGVFFDPLAVNARSKENFNCLLNDTNISTQISQTFNNSCAGNTGFTYTQFSSSGFQSSITSNNNNSTIGIAQSGYKDFKIIVGCIGEYSYLYSNIVKNNNNSFISFRFRDLNKNTYDWANLRLKILAGCINSTDTTNCSQLPSYSNAQLSVLRASLNKLNFQPVAKCQKSQDQLMTQLNTRLFLNCNIPFAKTQFSAMAKCFINQSMCNFYTQKAARMLQSSSSSSSMTYSNGTGPNTSNSSVNLANSGVTDSSYNVAGSDPTTVQTDSNTYSSAANAQAQVEVLALASVTSAPTNNTNANMASSSSSLVISLFVLTLISLFLA